MRCSRTSLLLALFHLEKIETETKEGFTQNRGKVPGQEELGRKRERWEKVQRGERRVWKNEREGTMERYKGIRGRVRDGKALVTYTAFPPAAPSKAELFSY